jgi:hypothetical protein
MYMYRALVAVLSILAFGACATSTAKPAVPAGTVIDTTVQTSPPTTVALCDLAPQLMGCPLYSPPTVAILPPIDTFPTAPPTTVNYADQLTQCIATYPVNLQQINQTSQETLGRDATPAEIQQIVVTMCEQEIDPKQG